jgi:hypothetical protein
MKRDQLLGLQCRRETEGSSWSAVVKVWSVTTYCGVRLIKIQELLLMHVYFGKGYPLLC